MLGLRVVSERRELASEEETRRVLTERNEKESAEEELMQRRYKRGRQSGRGARGAGYERGHCTVSQVSGHR